MMLYPDIRFREAGPEDADVIAALHVAAWQETYRDLLPEPVLASMTIARRSAVWRKILSTPAAFSDTRVHVAELAGDMLGFGACGLQQAADLAAQGYDGEIGSIYLRRRFQRQGVGARLMRRMASDLAERGRRAMALWVLEGNATARSFYERLGGAVVGQKEERRGSAVLVEMAYGWSDLRLLSQID